MTIPGMTTPSINISGHWTGYNKMDIGCLKPWLEPNHTKTHIKWGWCLLNSHFGTNWRCCTIGGRIFELSIYLSIYIYIWAIHICIYIYMCMYVYVYVYIYIYSHCTDQAYIIGTFNLPSSNRLWPAHLGSRLGRSLGARSSKKRRLERRWFQLFHQQWQHEEYQIIDACSYPWYIEICGRM